MTNKNKNLINYTNLLNDIFFKKGTQLEIAGNNGYTQGYVSYLNKLINNLEYKPKIKEDKLCCYICSDTNNLVIHHNHKTGIPIGIICQNCNISIGDLGEFTKLGIIKHLNSKIKKTYSKEWLTIEEYERLLKSVEKSYRDRLLIKLCYDGAFRISELLNAKREDFKKEGDTYTYLIIRNPKTNKGQLQTQPIDPQIYSELQTYCNEKGVANKEYVFSSNRSNKLSYPAVYKMFKKYAKKASIDKDITTHTLRRSRATHLIKEGKDLAFVSSWLRHTNVKTTMIYLNLEKEYLAKEMYKKK